jgi:daunorubicin resistance ABC transporter ATP-binding subunit
MIDYGGMTHMIEAEGLRKSFGTTQALNGLGLRVGAGRVTGLLGPNGAGKTTLVRIFATLTRPDAGLARVAGHDVVAEPRAVRRAIGLAGQYAVVDETLTGRENLEMTGRLYKLGRADARRQAALVLERLSLSDAADRPARTYSGGMRRRLDLGASLVGRPRVLLLDEPTTGLDPFARNELWSFIRELVADGVTVLLTTQLLDEADQLADDVVIIDRGTVVAQGAPDDLKARLGDDTVQLRVAAEAAQRAVDALIQLSAAVPEFDPVSATISLRVPSGASAVPAAVRALDEASVRVTGVTVSRPSLDDIFLALTGGALAGGRHG